MGENIVALLARHGGWLVVSIALISFSNATSGPFLFDGAYRISEWLHSCTHPLLLLCSSAHGTLFAGSDTVAITGNRDVDPSSDLADIFRHDFWYACRAARLPDR